LPAICRVGRVLDGASEAALLKALQLRAKTAGTAAACRSASVALAGSPIGQSGAAEEIVRLPPPAGSLRIEALRLVVRPGPVAGLGRDFGCVLRR